VTSVFCGKCGGWMINSPENPTIWECELCDNVIELDIEKVRDRFKKEETNVEIIKNE
jgi:DNA-directed RNA polymerase subunit M/transcription elongation factor TFIIS